MLTTEKTKLYILHANPFHKRGLQVPFFAPMQTSKQANAEINLNEPRTLLIPSLDILGSQWQVTTT